MLRKWKVDFEGLNGTSFFCIFVFGIFAFFVVFSRKITCFLAVFGSFWKSKKVMKNGENWRKKGVEKVMKNHAKFGRKMARKSDVKMAKNHVKKWCKKWCKIGEKSDIKSTEKWCRMSRKVIQKWYRISRHDDDSTNSSDEEDRTDRNDQLKGREGCPKGSSSELKGTKATDHEDQHWWPYFTFWREQRPAEGKSSKKARNGKG